MITSIIFSKDRPLQLDLCLSGVQQNFPDSRRIIVLYEASHKFFGAYEKLKTMHPNVEWWLESDCLFIDTLNAIVSSEDDYICFLTDDDIIYALAPVIDENLFGNPEVCCVSLRMGLNITRRRHNGQQGKDEPKVVLDASNDCICWPKSFHNYGSYWSYSLSVDGHVFRKQDILNMVDELCFLNDKYRWEQNPNTFEGALQRFWAVTPNYMCAPRQSVLVNSPNNRVSDAEGYEMNMAAESFSFNEDEFLDDFMNGSRIELEKLNIRDINCPHTEIDLIKGLP